jgi:serine/threonine protein phosphatase PrpC
MEGTVMPIDIHLFLQNIQAALVNQQYQHATFLLDYAIKLAEDQVCHAHLSSFDVALGLDRGRVRENNEDCVLAISGTWQEIHPFGLYVVCDGMGGHAHGQEAAHLAIRTMLQQIFPFLKGGNAPVHWEHFLAESIRFANQTIYSRNLSMQLQWTATDAQITPSHMNRMGTTLTAVLLFDQTAYVANVGDSRTYLYTHQELRRITKDHSLVAELLADGLLEEEDIYTHFQRNQITRALGTDVSVEVDTFVVPLPEDSLLLLCSDGLWEMTRDRKIEAILASSEANTSSLTHQAHQLVQLANANGGADNIGCVLVQARRCTDISMLTMALDPAHALTRWGSHMSSSV